MTHESAFTLIEVLTVLLIIAILSMLVMPGLQAMLQHAQDNTVRNNLTRMIETARDEAGLLHKTVTLCKSSDQRHCGGEWSDGQIIFVDARRDDTVHEASQIIAVNKMQLSRGMLHARFYPFYREAIHINPVVTEWNDNGTFWYCHAGKSQPVWAVKINNLGNVHEVLPDKNGDIKDAHGKLFQC